MAPSRGTAQLICVLSNFENFIAGGKLAAQCYAPFGNSDHAIIAVTNLNQGKPSQQSIPGCRFVVRRDLSDFNINHLRHIFETTDWSVFYDTNLDVHYEAITGYI